MYLTAEDLRDIIRDGSGIEYMTEYTIPYARFLLRSWGFTRKVPVGRHVRRASRQKIAWFRKRPGPLIKDEGRLHRMRAGRGDMRGRRAAQEGRLHAQGGPRRLHVHGIALQDHRVGVKSGTWGSREWAVYIINICFLTHKTILYYSMTDKGMKDLLERMEQAVLEMKSLAPAQQAITSEQREKLKDLYTNQIEEPIYHLRKLVENG